MPAARKIERDLDPTIRAILFESNRRHRHPELAVHSLQPTLYPLAQGGRHFRVMSLVDDLHSRPNLRQCGKGSV